MNELTYDEAAEVLGVTKSMISRLVSAGTLQARWLDKRTPRVTRESVEAYQMLPRKRGPKARAKSA